MSEPTPEGLVVRSRATREERVSKIGPVELYRSKARVIVFVGTDVIRTAGPELHGKIVQRNATDHTKIDAAITLPPDAMVKLWEALNSVEAVRDAGTVVIIPADSDAPMGRLQDVVEKLIALPALLNDLDDDTIARLDSGVHQVRRLTTMRGALSELDDLLGNGVVEEAKYQDWCVRNGWAFGIEYDSPDLTRSIAAEDHVDMLIPRLTGYRDVIELKRPDVAPILEDKQRGTWYWSGAAAKAISQVLRYAEKLAKTAEHGLDDHPEIVAYHPLGTIVIGRSKGWSNEQRRWLVQLNAALHGVQVMTYDDLRARGERMLRIVSEA